MRDGSAAVVKRETRRSIVSIGMNLRKALSSMTLALAMAAALIVVPFGAEAKTDAPAGTAVCNTASQNSQGGDMSVSSGDPQDPVHYSDDMRVKSNGNVNAAMHSHALLLCNVPTSTVPNDPP